MKPHLILIRGIPGSGKTTFAELLKRCMTPIPYHYENDMWMVNSRGEYKWHQDKVMNAVIACQEATKDKLTKGHDVIVSNTFTKPSDYRWATDLCKEKGYRLTVLTVEGDHGSIHDIPKDKMDYFRHNIRQPFRH